ncbi:hypothetical protein Hanom_Chr02g00148291 [Helianthus anomalus]
MYKPSSSNIKATLEDEIPEQLPVTTQKSLETTVATSSQQMVERSQPMPQTPPVSSKKEQVVQQGTPHYEALESFDSIFHSPTPGANLLSTPILTSQVPPTILPLLNTLDKDQTQISSSQQPITENMPQQVTESDLPAIVNQSTVEEVTPLELQVTPSGIPSEAATTSVEPTGLHLVSGYINKTSLESIPSITPLLSASEFVLTTGNIKRLSSVEGRRPQYR